MGTAGAVDIRKAARRRLDEIVYLLRLKNVIAIVIIPRIVPMVPITPKSMLKYIGINSVKNHLVIVHMSDNSSFKGGLLSMFTPAGMTYVRFVLTLFSIGYFIGIGFYSVKGCLSFCRWLFRQFRRHK